MASRLPAPLPLLAAAAGAAGFVASRALKTSAGAPPADTGAPATTPGADSSLAGSTAGDLWSQFGGGSSSAWGDGGTGGGVLPTGGPVDPGSPPAAGPPPAGAPLPTGPPTGGDVPPTHPATSPSSLGPRPAGASGWITATGLGRLWNLSGGVLHPQDSSVGYQFSAWVGGLVSMRVSTGSGTFSFRRILSGSHRGQYVHPSDARVSFHAG